MTSDELKTIAAAIDFTGQRSDRNMLCGKSYLEISEDDDGRWSVSLEVWAPVKRVIWSHTGVPILEACRRYDVKATGGNYDALPDEICAALDA